MTAERPRPATRSVLVAVLFATALGGCAVGPSYRRPELPLPERYDGATTLDGASGDVAPAEYWQTLADPQLTALVEEALRANHDVRIAFATVVEARARSRESLYDFAPTVTATGGRTESRTTRAAAALSGTPRRSNYFDAGFDATWELDLYGAVRRGREARVADARAAEAGWRAAQVAVAAEVVRAYLDLRGAQERLDVARRNADNQAATLKVTEARLAGGRGTELDRARASGQWLTTRASIPTLEADVRTASYRLAVLVGRSPEALLTELAVPKPLPTLPATLAIGAPADLLRRRPDVVQAERQLAAATARVGVAIADLFPRVMLVGSAGSVAAHSDGLFKGGNDVYSFGPRLDWAFLNLGRVREQIVASRAGADRALAAYQQGVLRALEDADGALVRYDRVRARAELLASAAEESARAAHLARRRFEGGATDFLTVLDAERSQLDAETLTVAARIDAATALVTVYKALGGGWREDR
jgi:multidrug efflux system outer membrane protein